MLTGEVPGFQEVPLGAFEMWRDNEPFRFQQDGSELFSLYVFTWTLKVSCSRECKLVFCCNDDFERQI